MVINGLVAKPELNGRTGTAVSFDDDKGRYSIELDDTSSSLLIKPCNLSPTVLTKDKHFQNVQRALPAVVNKAVIIITVLSTASFILG